MTDTTNFVDIIAKIHDDLDKFKDTWIQNNKTYPLDWPMVIANDNIGIVFEQFSMYEPYEEIDIDEFIKSIGFTETYNLIKCKQRNPSAQYFRPSSKFYHSSNKIDLALLKEHFDKLTDHLNVVVTFSYTDHDWPYAYQDDVIKTFDTPFEIDEWIKKNTVSRESYHAKILKWVYR